jgi:hypothetical protein
MALLLLSIVTSIQPARAYACSCLSSTPQSAKEQADAIFAGKALAVSLNPLAEIPYLAAVAGIKKSVLFDVTARWRGIAQSQVIVAVSESCCNWRPLIFTVGESYLVYGSLEPGGRLKASYFYGTRPLHEANDYLATLGGSTVPMQKVDLFWQFYAADIFSCLLPVTAVTLLAIGFRIIRKRRSVSAPIRLPD